MVGIAREISMKLLALIILFINFYPTWTFLNRLPGKCVGVQSLSCVWLFEAQWTAACQISLSFAISWSWLKLVIKSAMPSNHLILCGLLVFLPSTFPSSRWEVAIFISSCIFLLGRIYLPMMSCTLPGKHGSMFTPETGHGSRILTIPEWNASLL